MRYEGGGSVKTRTAGVNSILHYYKRITVKKRIFSTKKKKKETNIEDTSISYLLALTNNNIFLFTSISWKTKAPISYPILILMIAPTKDN